MIDTHVHLLKESYETNLQDVIEETISKLKYVFNVSWSIETAKEVIEINKKYSKIKPVIGIHPNHSQGIRNEDIKKIESLINENVIAIGEIGLDYYREGFNKEKQKEVFVKQIELAKKHKLPVIIHSRESIQDVIEIIKNYKDVKFLFHSWSGTIKQTELLNKWGNIYFSFNGIITYKNGENIRNLINVVRSDRVFLETDCPWLTPVPFRGKINYPEYVKYIYEEFFKHSNIEKDQIEKNINDFIK